MRVMEITTVMVVLLLGWSAYTLLSTRGWSLPPLPRPENLRFTEESLGFLKHHGDLARYFGVFGIMMAFGHSILAMSGEETLAQVYRDISHPKLKNLKRTALIIAVYSFIFTGICSLLAVMLIPDGPRMTLCLSSQAGCAAGCSRAARSSPLMFIAAASPTVRSTSLQSWNVDQGAARSAFHSRRRLLS